MNLVQIVKKAMIDNDIETMKELSVRSGVSYYKISGFLGGDESIKLLDLKDILDTLGLNIKFIAK